MATLCLSFWGTSRLSSEVAAPFYIPTSNLWWFQFFHILTNICCFFVFDYSHPSGYKVLSHWSLVCTFLMSNNVEYVLYVYWLFIYLHWKMFIQIVCHFLLFFIALLRYNWCAINCVIRSVWSDEFWHLYTPVKPSWQSDNRHFCYSQ